jgi:hypothetical protein
MRRKKANERERDDVGAFCARRIDVLAIDLIAFIAV